MNDPQDRADVPPAPARSGQVRAAKGPRVIGRRGMASVGMSSVVAGLSGYVVLLVVARYLDPAKNADFLVYWSLLFGGFAVLGGLQQETTRSIGSARLADRPVRTPARVLPWSIGIAVALAAAVAVASPWWHPVLLRGQPVLTVLLLCTASIAFAGHVTLVGTLAGARRWTTSSVLVGCESALRVVLTVVAVVAGADLLGLEVAVSLSAALWLVIILVSRTMRAAAGSRGEGTARELVTRELQAMVASTGAAALVVGFPTLLRLTTHDAQWATAAPLVLAISLTRAPLLMPLNAFQGVAISYFLDPHRSRAAALSRVVAVLVGVGVAGAVVADLVGPTLMAVFFGAPYRVAGMLLATLTLDSTVLAVLTMTGSAVLALGNHVLYATGWLVATAVAGGLLLVDLPLSARAALALGVGPLAGVAVHVVALLVTRSSPAEAVTSTSGGSPSTPVD